MVIFSLLFKGRFSFSFMLCLANSLIITFNVGVSSPFWLFSVTSFSSEQSSASMRLSLTLFFTSSDNGGLLIGVNGKLEILCIVGDNIPPGILLSFTKQHQKCFFLEIKVPHGKYLHRPSAGILLSLVPVCRLLLAEQQCDCAMHRDDVLRSERISRERRTPYYSAQAKPAQLLQSLQEIARACWKIHRHLWCECNIDRQRGVHNDLVRVVRCQAAREKNWFRR